MALKAGYYGIKKDLINLIKSLSGTKVIKTIGDALNLTAAGRLNVKVDGVTVKIVDNKLTAETAVTYESGEVDTGDVWIDENKIYRSIFSIETPFSFTASNSMDVPSSVITAADIDQPIRAYGLKTDSQTNYVIPLSLWITSSTLKLYAGDAWSNCDTFIIEYTKPAESGT